MNEVLLDQLPMLGGMLRGLEQLAIMTDQAVPTKNSFIVQVIPELRKSIVNGKDWKAIAEYQL